MGPARKDLLRPKGATVQVLSNPGEFPFRHPGMSWPSTMTPLSRLIAPPVGRSPRSCIARLCTWKFLLPTWAPPYTHPNARARFGVGSHFPITRTSTRTDVPGNGLRGSSHQHRSPRCSDIIHVLFLPELSPAPFTLLAFAFAFVLGLAFGVSASMGCFPFTRPHTPYSSTARVIVNLHWVGIVTHPLNVRN